MQLTRSTLGTLPKGPEFLQALQEDRLNQLRTAQAQQDLQTAPIERARQQEALQSEHTKNLGDTEAGDVTAWQNNPAYQKPWAQEPSEYRQHFISAYGPAAAQAPGLTNVGARAETQNPLLGTGVSNLPQGTQYRIDPTGGTEVQGIPVKSTLADDPIKQALVANQLSTVDAKGEPLTEQQAESELYNYQRQTGELPQSKQNSLTRQQQRYTASKEYNNALTSATSMGNFLSAFDDAIKNPNAANNLVLIDNFVRTQNPGVSVKQGTLNMIKGGQSIVQKFTPEYLQNHLEEGQFLTNQYMQQAKKALEEEVRGQADTFDKTFRASAIGNLKKANLPTDDFNNPYSQVLNRISQGPQSGQSQVDKNGRTVVNSQEQYDALPVGTQVVDSSGTIGVKK